MRKKVTALMMVAAMSCGALIACGSDSSTASSASYAGETVYGEVTALNDSGFTITVGTYSDGELTLGDESLEVTVTDSTKYSMNGAGQAPEGGKPDDAEAKEAPADMPEGEGQGEAPADMPEGEGQGEAPEDIPEGEGQGEAPADMPEDKPEGEAPSQDMEPAEISLESISVGTQVAVTYDADGNVEAVEIL